VRVVNAEGKPLANALAGVRTTVDDIIIDVCNQIGDIEGKRLQNQVIYVESHQNALHPDQVFLSYFPNASHSQPITVVMQALKEAQCNYVDPPRPSNDVLKQCAKVIQGLGKRGEDQITVVLQVLSTPALHELKQVKVPKKKPAKKSNAGKKRDRFTVDTLSFDKSLFFQKCSQSIVKNLELYRQNPNQTLMVWVDPQMTIESFIDENINNNYSTLQSMQMFNRQAMQMMCGMKRMTIMGAIVQGKRFFETKRYYETHQSELLQHNIESWGDFFDALGEGYSDRWLRDMQAIFVACKHYPNIALIDCCSITELLDNINYLLKFLAVCDDKASIIWRQGPPKVMAWIRATKLDSQTNPPIFNERAPTLSESEWSKRRKADTDTYFEDLKHMLKEQEEKEAEKQEQVQQVQQQVQQARKP